MVEETIEDTLNYRRGGNNLLGMVDFFCITHYAIAFDIVQGQEMKSHRGYRSGRVVLRRGWSRQDAASGRDAIDRRHRSSMWRYESGCDFVCRYVSSSQINYTRTRLR